MFTELQENLEKTGEVNLFYEVCKVIYRNAPESIL